MTARRSYSRLSRLPAWLLYDDKALVASVRAESAGVARALFKANNLTGTHMRRSRDAAA